MHYRSVADMSDTITRQLRKLPPDIDLVVGVPRSGLLAGSMISLALNLPLADLEGFAAGRLLATGHTRRRSDDGQRAAPRKILVVDDSINSGGSMVQARKALIETGVEAELVFCAVYGLKNHHPEVDVVLETVPYPRMFQWNAMHHSYLADACFDIDGVLCCDPTAEENDDGDRYRAFLTCARAFLRPSKPVGHLVTSRLEKYRPETEAWLAAEGIEYGKLWMLDLPDAAARRKAGAHGAFKARVYASLPDAALFIESEERQAVEIARASGKPVLSIESQTMIYPDRVEELTAMRQRRVGYERRRREIETPAPSGLKGAARRLLGAPLYDQLKRAVRAPAGA